MNILIVDDEPLVLASVEAEIAAALPSAQRYSFTKAQEALDFAQTTPMDLAFLDINMRFIDGISMAKQLLTYYPKLNIVFCTGYPECAIDAVETYFSDYILKPITADKLQRALAHLRFPIEETKPLLTVHVCGGFEAFDQNGAALSFKRSRAKELLAILVDQKGTPLAPWEISEQLWFGVSTQWDEKHQNYFYQLFYELNRVLREVGAISVLKKVYEGIFLDMSQIYVDDMNSTSDGYMNGYSWAEQKM